MKPNTSAYPSLSGSKMLLLHMATVIVAVLFFAYSEHAPFGILLLLVALAMFKGYFIVKPQEGRYITFFGEYKGYASRQGLHWINPLLRTTVFSTEINHEYLQEQSFCDAQGTSLRLSASIAWTVQDHQKAFAHSQKLAALVPQQTLAAWAHILGKWPYQGKEDAPSLKGNKALVERELWKHLQERIHDLGLQVVSVALVHLAVDDVQYLQLAQQKSQLGLEAQARKSWVLQAPPMAAHLVKQLRELPQAPKLSPSQEQTLLEKIVLKLIG